MNKDAPQIGIGLRHPHYHYVIEHPVPIDWFEVHSENFFQHGPPRKNLEFIAEQYPISLHGVGLSLGAASRPSVAHLKRLRELIDAIKPIFVSEHLSWGKVNGRYLPDLLPVPYCQEALDIMVDNICFVQDFLGQLILIENPSSYLEYHLSTIPEPNFLLSLCQRSQAKLLLDVNNVYVSCHNHAWDAKAYIDACDSALIAEIHLAGHSETMLSDGSLLKLDTHDTNICDPVWDLYRYTISTKGSIPTLIEWDSNIPSIDVLINEARKARQIVTQQVAV